MATATARPRFKAALTQEQVFNFDATFDQTLGDKRRMTLVTLSRSSKELIDGFTPIVAQDNGDAMIELIHQIGDYRDHLKAGLEMADAAIARLMMVGEYIAQQEA